MALQRAGMDATIYEAYDRPADAVGSFLNLSSNGIDALRAIGARPPVLDVGFSTPRMVMWSGSGKRLGEVANGLTLDDGTTSQTVQRGCCIARCVTKRRGAASRSLQASGWSAPNARRGVSGTVRRWHGRRTGEC